MTQALTDFEVFNKNEESKSTKIFQDRIWSYTYTIMDSQLRGKLKRQIQAYMEKKWKIDFLVPKFKFLRVQKWLIVF